jgi:DNA-binding winged helix-turn-helix (wHTH) protein/tetratricopeptide (TPR) repeat protein
MSSGPTTTTTIYRFGVFEANTQTGELLRKGVRAKLQEQPFQLLTFLVENAGEIVSRESVRQRLWPANTFVDFDASLSVAVGKLRDALGDDADSPRFIETVPRRGYRFVAPVQRVVPSVVAADSPSEVPERPQPGVLPGEFSNHHWRLKAAHIALIAVLALGLVGIFIFRSIRKQPESTAEAKTSTLAPQIRRSVAVLGFRNIPGRKDDDWLSQAFTEMLSTELAAGGSLRVVSDEDIARSKRELTLGDEDTLAKPTLARLRKNPGADVVVVGSYTPLPGKDQDRIRLDVRLQDTASGETIAEDAVTGSKEDLFEIATRAGADLRKSLGVNAISLDSTNAVRASLPASQEAVRFYSEGRAKLWMFDFVGARDLLAKAVKVDPEYPLAHSALSDALWHLGYAAKSVAEAKRAIELSGSLPEEERLRIEGSYRGTMSDWSGAVDAYRTLFQLHPDNLEYGLKLAGAQYHAKAPDALFTLKVLRQLPLPAGDDPRIDLLEASAQVTQDLAAARVAAQRAIAKGNAQGSPLIVARGYGILCQQGAARGISMTDTVHDCENARQSYAAAGDHYNETRTLNDLAGIYFQTGDLPKAESMWRTAQAEFRKLADPGGLAATSNNLGDVLLTQGNLGEAKKSLEASIPNYQATEDKSGVAIALNDLGEIERRRGNLRGAETFLQRAKTTASEVGDKSVLGYVLSGMGDVLKDRDDLASARKSYEESLALRSQIGEKQTIAETKFSLAELAIEEGHPSDAEEILRKGTEEFHREQQADDELLGEVALIRALRAEGKQVEAIKELDRAKPLADSSHNILARLQFELELARTLLESDHPERSRTHLEQIVKAARSHGFVGLEFETGIALAELEKKSGNGAAAKAQLVSVEKAARERGLALIARKAVAARG